VDVWLDGGFCLRRAGHGGDAQSNPRQAIVARSRALVLSHVCCPRGLDRIRTHGRRFGRREIQ